ncbi:MAG: hypothetical protein K9M10_03670 [Candidatus Pacebacteria bacterium]|nr:hypothetical protein [Candidatus Paceibacterota bacterium]MCF7857550.1 hypothetical protein [Candidatus Paceibacterota bacterium]
MKISIVTTSMSPEVIDIMTKADALGVDCEQVKLETPNKFLTDADIVYWRSSRVTKDFKKSVGRSTAMLQAAAQTKIINDVLMNNTLITSKSYQQSYIKYKAPHIRGIDSYLVADESTLIHLIEQGILTYPIIAKPDFGSQGNGIELISAEEELKNLKNISTYVFQNLIPNTCDYRVFVVGGIAVDVVRRQSTEQSTKMYLNNLSQGGKSERVSDPQLYAKLAKKAEAIANVFDLTVCGVDLIQHAETKDLYFLEINTAPQWIIFGDALTADVGEMVAKTCVYLASRKKTFSVSDIRDYYEQNAGYLQPDKRFHFYSRLFLWTRDESYMKELDLLRYKWLPDIQSYCTLAKKIPLLQAKPRSGGRIYRQSSYQKHYKVYKYNRIFFKALFLKTIYGESVEALIGAIDAEDIQRTREELCNDKEAIFALSTHAVNFLYHYEHFFNKTVNPQYILDIGKTYTLSEPTHSLEARTYLYTHAIIGASHFYEKRTITENRSVYIEMLKEIETDMQYHFSEISLDIKCEFVVCAALVDYESTYTDMIASEVALSVSKHANYIVDTYNSKSSKIFKNGFHASEHRNVLAIMAFDKKAE